MNVHIIQSTANKVKWITTFISVNAFNSFKKVLLFGKKYVCTCFMKADEGANSEEN